MPFSSALLLFSFWVADDYSEASFGQEEAFLAVLEASVEVVLGVASTEVVAVAVVEVVATVEKGAVVPVASEEGES